MNREQTIEKLRANPDVSVLIIGGGINGIGTFRDLALQGVDVVLAERGDFCSGASAASSHMLHGGLRYLENAEFRLVNEALHERNLLLKNAPHYARPLPTTIPIFRWFSGMLNAPLKFLGLLNKPAERGAIIIKAGLFMYDWFTRDSRIMPTHEFAMRQRSLELYPNMSEDIICTATYYDGFMPAPERLGLELGLDGEAANPDAHALNYLGAVDGGGDTVTLRDELSGETLTLKPKLVINAAGPWIDFVNKAMNTPSRFIGGTKGSHLIVDHPDLLAATGNHEIFFENEDGRIVLILPYLGKVMVGTTDIRIDNPDEAVCTEDEIDYMLTLIRKVFPTIEVDRSHIVFNFCGVRPLPAQDANTTGQISRDHSIRVVEPGNGTNYPIYSLVGGKWTSFRAFSEQTADKTLDTLGHPRKLSTVDEPIGGGHDYPASDSERAAWVADVAQETGLSAERIETLLERYGTRARAMAQFMVDGDDTPLQSLPAYSQRELIYLAYEEKVLRLDDLLLRRTLIAMLGEAQSPVIAETAAIVGAVLGWDAERIQSEIERTQALFAARHGMTFAQPA